MRNAFLRGTHALDYVSVVSACTSSVARLAPLVQYSSSVEYVSQSMLGSGGRSHLIFPGLSFLDEAVASTRRATLLCLAPHVLPAANLPHARGSA